MEASSCRETNRATTRLLGACARSFAHCATSSKSSFGSNVATGRERLALFVCFQFSLRIGAYMQVAGGIQIADAKAECFVAAKPAPKAE